MCHHIDSPKILPNGLTAISNGLKAHNPPIAINLSTSDGISPALLNASNAAAAMPLNLIHHPMTNGITNGHSIRTASVTSNGLQIISNTTPIVTNGKNGMRHLEHNSKDQIKRIDSISTSSEPPTKVIKLINSNGITLASVDKDSKLIPSGQLTLSQVVVSQIPLLTPTQTLRVIGPAPNGVATIELSNSNGMLLLHSTLNHNAFLELKKINCNFFNSHQGTHFTPKSATFFAEWYKWSSFAQIASERCIDQYNNASYYVDLC